MNEYLSRFHAIQTNRDFPWGIDCVKRDPLVREFAWAVPSDEAIAAIAELSPIIEVGAGTGYWAMLLQQAGADVLAFDIAPPDKSSNSYRHTKTWFPVQQGDASVAALHPDRTLMLCWPNYSDSFAFDCLSAYQGDRLVFIGEGNGGCTGSEEFFVLLAAEWTLQSEVMLPQWAGIHDYLSIYHRTKTLSKRKEELSHA